MRIIGVIDLKDGQAVHARGGRRDEYRPVSEAAGTVINGDAVKLAGVYLESFGLTDIYVADLDAIASAARERWRRAAASAGLVETSSLTAVSRRWTRRTASPRLALTKSSLDWRRWTSFDVLRDICRHLPCHLQS